MKTKCEDPPTIMIREIRDEDGELTGRVALAPFKPGMLLERGGKVYLVRENGSQMFVGYHGPHKLTKSERKKMEGKK